MKVKKLINELKQFNPDADITLTTSESITLSYISKDPLTNNELNKQTTSQVFIEPADFCEVCASQYDVSGVPWCSYYDTPCDEVKMCCEFQEC